MVMVVMQDMGMALQEAIDFVGDLCKGSFDRFKHDRQHVPSWGDEIDLNVAKYIDGLQNWMVGEQRIFSIQLAVLIVIFQPICTGLSAPKGISESSVQRSTRLSTLNSSQK